MENVVLVKNRVKPQVVNLQSEYHVDLGVVGVRWERTDAKLDHSHRCYQHQYHIEKKAVHPSLVFLHRMEAAAARNSDSEFDSSLLNTPEHVQTEIREKASGKETCIAIIKTNEKLIEERNQRSTQSSLGDIAENAIIREVVTSEGPIEGMSLQTQCPESILGKARLGLYLDTSVPS